MKNWGVALSAICLASGCATSTNYTPPTKVGVVNSAKVDRPFDAVWDQLVRELSSDFFVINNIDKSSRLINISFSSNRPSDFVDCGSTARSSNSMFANGVTRYMTADSVNYRTATNLGQPIDVNRITKLDGRTNIYVAPDGTGTSVVVNTKYVLDIRTILTALNGNTVGRTSGTIDFSTKTPSTATSAQPACMTKGVIETKILSSAGLKT